MGGNGAFTTAVKSQEDHSGSVWAESVEWDCHRGGTLGHAGEMAGTQKETRTQERQTGAREGREILRLAFQNNKQAL